MKLFSIVGVVLGISTSNLAMAEPLPVLPVPIVKVELRAGVEGQPSTAESYAIVHWRIEGGRDYGDQYGFKVELQSSEGRDVIALIEPAPFGDDEDTYGGQVAVNFLERGQSYTVFVTTYDRLGRESLPGSKAFVYRGIVEAACTPDTSCKAEGFNVDIEDGVAILNWTPVCGATGYDIYRNNAFYSTSIGSQNSLILPVADFLAGTYEVRKKDCTDGTHCPISMPAIGTSTLESGTGCTNSQQTHMTFGACGVGRVAPYCSSITLACPNTPGVSELVFGAENPATCFPYRCCIRPVENNPDSRCPANKPKSWGWYISPASSNYTQLLAEFTQACTHPYWKGQVTQYDSPSTGSIKMCCYE